MKYLWLMVTAALIWAFVLSAPVSAGTRHGNPADNDAQAISGIGLPPWLQFSDPVDNDARAIYGAGSLLFSEIVSDPKQSWVIADIAPGKLQHPGDDPTRASGYSHFDDKRGMAMEIFGKFKPLYPLTKAAPTGAEDFAWTGNGGGTSIHPIINPVSPFMYGKGGVAVCRVNRTLQGAERYSPVYMIPASWQTSLRDAFNFYGSHRALFEMSATDQGSAVTDTTQETQLHKLLTDGNPFLMEQAARTLALGPGLDAVALEKQVQEARGLRQALLTYLLLKYTSDKTRGPGTSLLLEWLRGVTDVNRITGVALGAYTSKYGVHGDQNTHAVLAQLVQSQRALSGNDVVMPPNPLPNTPPEGLSDKMSKSAAGLYLSNVLYRSGT